MVLDFAASGFKRPDQDGRVEGELHSPSARFDPEKEVFSYL